MLSRAAGGWVRWGIPALWLGWVAVYLAASLLGQGLPHRVDALRWLAPALLVLLTVRHVWSCNQWAQVRDAGDALEIVQHGRTQRVDVAQLRSVDAAWLIPPVRLVLRFHGERGEVVFLPASAQDHTQLATMLQARASARRAVQASTT
ncbi:hypothetical protein [Xanthomonas maliensis]|uniref:hypothetical protein n=1 Tax=Xanthomonas maliensis TaxID=1321368 RepID=UPI00039D09B4|nr:hypothetical protein [Xanthomonas maliensis]KAB7771339.1 hypothetical protein CKY51_02845 [Xanthomonas maliensis]